MLGIILPSLKRFFFCLRQKIAVLLPALKLLLDDNDRIAMKKILFFLLAAVCTLTLAAQNPEPYEFKEFKRLPATPVKSQDNTGTCWCFSTTSFLESELLRMGKGEYNLSEMFTVRNIYRQKCENYVRRLGTAQFGQGGLAHDNLNAIRNFGVVPETIYPGRKDPSKRFNHTQIEQTLKNKCDEFVALGKKGELPENWLGQIDALLDEEFGPVPITFVYNNVQYTPSSFRDYLGLNPDDYVNITSFSHHPFWTSFVLEVPDNFANGQFFNVPLSDMIRCLNYSIQQGYTVEWDADVSNPGFSARNGLAVVPETDWSAKTATQVANTFKYWEPEKVITQPIRQQAFDRLETQDDHLMHITGILNEDQGGIYYSVKNSWGEISDLKGYVYVSEAYMRLNTISITVHKNALPSDIRKRMGLEAGDVNIEKTGATGNTQNTDTGLDPLPGTDHTDTPPPSQSRIQSRVGNRAIPAPKNAKPLSKE